MKILAVAHYYAQFNKSGGERYLQAILEYLAKSHQVTMMETSTRAADAVYNAVDIVYKPITELEKQRADIYVTQFNEAAEVLRVARLKKKPVIYIAHNDTAMTRDILKKLKPRDTAVFNTNWIAKKFNTPAKKLVIHPPTNRDVFKPVESNKQYITLVNPTMAKGAGIFYGLALAFRQRKFLVVEGGYFKEQQRLYTFPNVTIQRQTENMMKDVYERSRIVLMPSVYETWGFVAREAACAGIPVICAPTDGLIENLGDAGIYAKDLNGYIRAITELDDKRYYDEVKTRLAARVGLVDMNEELKQLDNVL